MADKWTQCHVCFTSWPRAPAGYIHKCGSCGVIMTTKETTNAAASNIKRGGYSVVSDATCCDAELPVARSREYIRSGGFSVLDDLAEKAYAMVRDAEYQGEGKVLDVDRRSVHSSPLSRQEGGDHYKKYKIQPVEYAMANGLNYCQANAVKYVTRYRDKGGIEDLRKAIHNLEILIQLEENGSL